MKKFKIKVTNHGMIHQIAHCQNCPWMEEDFLTAHKCARKHAEETGHTISVETGIHKTVGPVL